MENLIQAMRVSKTNDTEKVDAFRMKKKSSSPCNVSDYDVGVMFVLFRELKASLTCMGLCVQLNGVFCLALAKKRKGGRGGKRQTRTWSNIGSVSLSLSLNF